MEGKFGEMINEFAKYCIEWNKLLEAYDSKNANKEYRKIKRIFEEIRLRENANEFYESLLNSHSEEAVIVPATTQMLVLNIDVEKATLLLQKIRDESTNRDLSFSAKMVLMEWNKGKLNNF